MNLHINLDALNLFGVNQSLSLSYKYRNKNYNDYSSSRKLISNVSYEYKSKINMLIETITYKIITILLYIRY